MQTLLSNFSCKSQKNSGLDKAKLLDHVYHDDELDPIPERVGRATPKPPPARCHPSYQDLMGRVHCDLKLFRASFDDDEKFFLCESYNECYNVLKAQFDNPFKEQSSKHWVAIEVPRLGKMKVLFKSFPPCIEIKYQAEKPFFSNSIWKGDDANWSRGLEHLLKSFLTQRILSA
ncbi:MAG: hypothetical protein L7U87_01830 [Chlamydiales bacterium]|nr:hypothetical protein [Chlamydiales bacterium]